MNLQQRDRTLLGAIDEAFDRARDAYGPALPCSRGCSACCVAFFGITSLDVWRLREGLASIDAETRARIVARAEAIVERVRERLPDWSEPFDIREIGEREFVSLASAIDARCPALGDSGECLVYAHRPRVCHLQGLKFVDPKSGETLDDHCAAVFGSEAYAAIPAQPLALGDQWEEEAELRRAVGGDAGFKTFVAAAIGQMGRMEETEAP